MKSLRFKIIAILLTSIVMGVLAGEVLTKEYHEQYATGAKTNFKITNRYGKVDIVNTIDDQMTIDVLVKVDATSQSKAQAIIDEIHITLKQEGDVIVALTEISNSRWRGNVSFQIDYTIKMPAYVNTNLACHYGEVTIAEISGPFSGTVKYGSLTANALTYAGEKKINTINLAYCDHSAINSYSDMDLSLAYSKMRLGNGNVVNFSSKYSDLKVKEVAVIKGSITYGDIKISNALDVNVTGRYSDISVGVLHGSLVVDTKYGDLEVDQLSHSFSNVKVAAAYSDVDISVSSKAEYKLFAKANYGHLDYPSMSVISADDVGKTEIVNGYVGSGSSSSKIEAIVSYGDVDIRTF